jgi:hypothetical protein
MERITPTSAYPKNQGKGVLNKKAKDSKLTSQVKQHPTNRI